MVCVGNALVDVLASATDEDLAELDLVKGTMVLVDQERSAAIYERMGATTEASGGSAANTAAGVAALGGRAAFLGRVADDGLGRAFTHDIRSIGVAFDPDPHPGRARARWSAVTAWSWSPTTPSGPWPPTSGWPRSSAPSTSTTAIWPRPRSSTSRATCGSSPRPRRPCGRPSRWPTGNDAAVALTVSDPFCVQHHRAEFLDLLAGDLELVFANEEEAMMLFGASTFDAAVDALAETGVLAVLTRGAGGSVVVTASGPVEVPAAPVDRVVDTTGAGDLFAAGFLYGITNGLRPEEAARLGGVCAAEVISHVGARPQADLRALAVEAGLFA